MCAIVIYVPLYQCIKWQDLVAGSSAEKKTVSEDIKTTVIWYENAYDFYWWQIPHTANSIIPSFVAHVRNRGNTQLQLKTNENIDVTFSHPSSQAHIPPPNSLHIPLRSPGWQREAQPCRKTWLCSQSTVVKSLQARLQAPLLLQDCGREILPSFQCLSFLTIVRIEWVDTHKAVRIVPGTK